MNLSLKNLQKKLKDSGQSFQPLVVAVGGLTDISEYLVVINNICYKRKSCLSAVELAFKIFFAVDCNYPENSSTLWVFVQKCIFHLRLPTDINNLSLNILPGHISEKLKQLQNE